MTSNSFAQRALAFFALLTCLLTLTACGSYGGAQADVDQEQCPPDRPELNQIAAKQRPSAQGTVFVLSITNQGEWVNRCAYTDLLVELSQSTENVLVVLYIHGWKNNTQSEDRKNFDFFVKRVADSESGAEFLTAENQIKKQRAPRHVIGVYVGWPGSTLDLPFLENLTYWGRQKAADRISQSGVLAKIISGIRSVRPGLGERVNSGQRDQLVLIGHSFGARILLTATSQIQIQAMEFAHPGTMLAGRPLRPTEIGPQMRSRNLIHAEANVDMPRAYGCIESGLMTVLVNPAVEAFTYSAFHNARRADHIFNVRQQPVMLVIASENDQATKIAFPLGQALGLNWHEKETSTIGNFPPFQTHLLNLSLMCRTASARWYDAFLSSEGVCLSRSSEIFSRDTNSTLSKVVGDRRFTNQSGNPFIMARASREVIDGHNGNWGLLFTAWLLEFVTKVETERLDNSCFKDDRPDRVQYFETESEDEKSAVSGEK